MYSAREISQKDALVAWKNANETSLFCNPNYLSLLDHKVTYIGGFKNEELLAVWPILNDNNFDKNIPPFSYYFGPYSLYVYKSLPPYKAYKNHLDVYSCLIEKVLKVKNNLHFFLVPEFFDLRPFQWWNYDVPDKGQFKISLRYTAHYYLNKFDNQNQMILTFRPDDKRKKLKKLFSKNEFYVSIDKDFDPEFLCFLYKETISSSGGYLSINDSNYLTLLLKFAKEKQLSDPRIFVLLLKSKKDNSIHGFQLILIGKKRSYAIAQSVTSYARKASASILLTSFSIEFSKKLDCQIFDFNGANSPKRGDDKHAFGAYTVPYMELSI